MRRLEMRRLAALILFPLTAIACADGGPTDLASESGQARVFLGLTPGLSTSVAPSLIAGSAPPVDFAEIGSLEFVIDRVEAHRVSGGAWVSIDIEPVTIDLASIAEGSVAEVAAGTLPAGTYNQLRFFLAGATVTFLNDISVGNSTFVAGQVHDLDIPSADNNGLRINTSHFVVDESAETVVVLFDPASTTASIGVTGSGRVRMSPVLREADHETESEVEDVAGDSTSEASGE